MAVAEAHVERMKIELRELDTRFNALSAFLLTPQFDALPDIDRALLQSQRAAMDCYRTVLNYRLERAG